MVPQGHAGCADGIRRAQVTRQAGCEARQAALATPVRREKKSCWRRDSPAPGSRFHYGSVFPRMASKPSTGAEKEQVVADVYRLHKPQ